MCRSLGLAVTDWKGGGGGECWVDVFRRLLEDTDTRENDIRLLCVQGINHATNNQTSNQNKNPGIPDVDGLRARCWKILLGYTPPGSGEAQAKLSRSRELYYEYVDTTVQGQPQNESAQTSDHVRCVARPALSLSLSLSL